MKTKITFSAFCFLGFLLLFPGWVISQNHPDTRGQDRFPTTHFEKGRMGFPGKFPFRQEERHQLTFKSHFKETAGGSDSVQLVGRWANGPCFAVSVDSQYVYFGNGAYFQIEDRNDTSGRILGKLMLPSLVNGIVIKDHYAFVADSKGGLRIIDISDPSHPVETGFIETVQAMDVSISGHYAYVADGFFGLRIINISDPAHPSNIGFFYTDGYASDVTVAGNYAYVADVWDGLRIINISNPAHPTETGFFDTRGYAYGVSVVGKYAYVADDKDGLRIINISDTANLSQAGFYDTGGDAYAVTVSGNYAYVADGNDGLRIINISDTAHPVETGFFDTNGLSYAITVSGNYAYVADRNDGLRIIDISDTAHPIETNSFNTGGNAYAVTVSGNYAYVADSWNGDLNIINISDLSHPVETGSFNTGNTALDVAVSGNYAYVAAGENGLLIINVSNPLHPVKTDFFNLNGMPTFGVTVSGNYAYVAVVDGLHIINISDPAHPVETGFFNTSDYAVRVTIAGNYAYVADYLVGLLIINISDPAHPVETGSFNTGNKALDVAVSGKYAYVANANDGLRIIDISDPAHPKETGFTEKNSYADGVIVVGNYVYVAENVAGLHIINISDPTHPTETSSFSTGDYAFDVTAVDNLVYVADYQDGLYILKNLGIHYPHFTPVWKDNPYQPMNIIIKSADIDGVGLKAYDEIGVFFRDSIGNEICVGDASVWGHIDNNHPLLLTASADDPTTMQLDGFQTGHQIYYKVWNEETKKISSNVAAVYDPTYDSAFTQLGTAVVSLSGHPTVETSLNSISTCPGKVTVPVSVKNFSDIKSFSLKLYYDSAFLKFTGYQNVNSQLEDGTSSIKDLGDSLLISWSATSPANIISDSLVELSFIATRVYSRTNANLNWDSINSYYRNSSSDKLETMFHNGLITIEPVPESAGIIDGPDSVCLRAQNILYHIGKIVNATDYYWEISPANAGTLTKKDTSATINFSGNFTGMATLSVYGSDSCGDGDTSMLNITVLPSPTANAGLDDTICENATYQLAGQASHQKSVAWTTSGDGSFSDSSSLSAVYTPGKQDIANGSVKLVLTAFTILPCGTNASDTINLALAKYPDKPSSPVGTETILMGQDQSSAYTIAQVNHANAYTWYLYPSPDAGTISGEDTTGTVTWNSTFTKTTAYVYVEAQNKICGSTFSDSLEIRTSPVGILQVNSSKLNILIAPNPSQGKFKAIINDAQIEMELTIIDQKGQVIKRMNLINTSSQKFVKEINLTHYPSGIYYLRFVSGTSTTIKRVVIRH